MYMERGQEQIPIQKSIAQHSCEVQYWYPWLPLTSGSLSRSLTQLPLTTMWKSSASPTRWNQLWPYTYPFSLVVASLVCRRNNAERLWDSHLRSCLHSSKTCLLARLALDACHISYIIPGRHAFSMVFFGNKHKVWIRVVYSCLY